MCVCVRVKRWFSECFWRFETNLTRFVIDFCLLLQDVKLIKARKNCRACSNENLKNPGIFNIGRNEDEYWTIVLNLISMEE